MIDFRTEAVKSILVECDFQDKKWGAGRTHSWGNWLSILVEEVGEAATEILKISFDFKPTIDLRKELVQCAAVCIQIIEDIDREAANPKPEEDNE